MLGLSALPESKSEVGKQRDEIQALARPLSRMDERRLLVRLLQLSVKARLAHSACFAAVALQEVMTAGRRIEVRAVQRRPFELAVTSVPHWTHFSPMIRLHRMQNRVIYASPSSGMNRMTLNDYHAQLESAWTSQSSHRKSQLHASSMSWSAI
jgi:hypothetical protein